MANMNKKLATEIVGWYGVMAVLLAYALTAFAVIASASWAFVLLNLTGALALALMAYRKKDRQPMVLNVVWALIALVALFELVQRYV